MSSSDDSFNATGSTVVAFETTNNTPSNQTFGVSVTGTQCGVFGQSSLSPKSTRPDTNTVSPGTGVRGYGVALGVHGTSDDGSGVYGWGKRGVEGLGKVGVLATHSVGGAPPVAEEAALAAEARGIPATGVGVVGLRSWSEFNRAGVFGTGEDYDATLGLPPSRLAAQIHLVPRDAIDPPRDGRAGDLLVITGPVGQLPADAPRPVQLLFCTVSAGPTGFAVWVPLV